MNTNSKKSGRAHGIDGLRRHGLSAEDLLRRSRRERDARVRVRMILIANILSGMSREEAARSVGLSRQVGYNWAHRFEAEGLEGLRDRPRPGRPPKVDPATRKRLRVRLREIASPAEGGRRAVSVTEVRRILREEFGISCSRSAAYALLARLGLDGE